MKKFSILALMVLVVTGLSFAQVKGPIVDKILFDGKTQEDIGLKDVASGKGDLWNYGTSGSAFKALPDDIKAQLDVYNVTGVSYLSIYLNPYPNKAPYLTDAATDVAKKVQFNPFAIREVRYAMNFLMNRKKIIDEIMVGSGLPMYTAVTPTQPNSSKYDLIAAKQGFTPAGNEKKAIADITDAITKASKLPELAGKLTFDGKFWNFNGEPVTVNFLIRVDDPNVRLPEGRYLADQIEKAGIKVTRTEQNRTALRVLWGNSDPKTYQWNLYTEGWGGGQTYAFWETSIAQMYAPWYANMPGTGKGGFWNYENADLDKLTGDAVNGRVKDTADYYDKLAKSVDIGLKEAVRVFVAAQTTYYAASKDRMNSRMIYGLGDGINKFSYYTADVKPETSGADKGLKVLRSSGFSSQGNLFMSSWDPLGPNGFSDIYSAAIIKEASDMEMEANPVTGIPMELRATYKGLDTKLAADGVSGAIKVPATAVLWNAKTQKWESGLNYVDVKKDGSEFDYVAAPNNTAISTATFTFKFGAWHHGRAVDINDYRYALSIPYDLSNKATGKVYEEEYAGAVNPNLPRNKGVVFNADNTITAYGDVNYPMDKASLAALLVPSLMVQGSNYGSIVPWEILEAIKGVVAEGNASGTAYSYNSDEKFVEMDLLSQKTAGDLRAKLVEYAAAKRVPAALVGFVKPETAAANYNLAIKFIDAHGHAYISNGGFMLDKYDPKSFNGQLVAFRDKAYPYEKGYFATALATKFSRIDSIKVDSYKKGTDLKVTATLSEVVFPANSAKAMGTGKVNVTVIADKEYTFAAKMSKAGTFVATVPAKTLDALKAGSYTVVVDSALASESPTVETTNVLIF
ncbi:MAG: ABC transporter substrate-binding protein [Spirochaetales bacterium]